RVGVRERHGVGAATPRRSDWPAFTRPRVGPGLGGWAVAPLLRHGLQPGSAPPGGSGARCRAQTVASRAHLPSESGAHWRRAAPTRWIGAGYHGPDRALAHAEAGPVVRRARPAGSPG